MLYTSSKINDLNSQVLSTSVFGKNYNINMSQKQAIHTIPVIPI